MAQKIYKTADGQTIIANTMNDVTNVSFKENILKFHSYSIAPIIYRLAFSEFAFLPVKSIAKIVSRQSLEFAKKQLEGLEKVVLPDKIFTLLKNDLKKKEQEKIWRGLSLDISQLGAIFLHGEELGYKFSSYRFEGTPKNFKKEDRCVGHIELVHKLLDSIILFLVKLLNQFREVSVNCIFGE